MASKILDRWAGPLAVLVLLGLMAWSLVPMPPRLYAPTGPGQVYLALGDSLAWGFRLQDRGRESYPALIQAQLAQRSPISLVNLSVPGETAASLRGAQLDAALRLIAQERAAGRRVSPITIDIGGNDLRRAAGDEAAREVALRSIRRDIGAALDALRRAAGDADIAVMTYYNPYGGDPADRRSEAYWVERLNSAIAAEAQVRGAAVADAYTPFGGGRAYTYTNILLGDIHANRQGHVVIAGAFWRALRYEAGDR